MSSNSTAFKNDSAFPRLKGACDSCSGYVTNCKYYRRTVELRDGKERCIIADMEDIKMVQAVLEREPNSAATEIANAAPTPKNIINKKISFSTGIRSCIHYGQAS